MTDYEKSALWRTLLAARADDPHEKTRERLRTAYTSMRAKVAHLVGEIARDLPDYTVHDITHLDALWEYCSLVAGDMTMTPVEGFVLGGAILLHDAGMSLAAYPGRMADLEREPMWADAATFHFRHLMGREATADDLRALPNQVQIAVKSEVLREAHAKKAAELATCVWTNGGEHFHVIDDAEIRTALGPIIGQIAASHWWSVDKVRENFKNRRGAPAFLPSAWTFDPAKIAALLRVGDASHIDAGRAPAFLRAIRAVGEISGDHWVFQGKMAQPQVEAGLLHFNSNCAFPESEAGAWWLAHDALTTIDREIRQSNALLRELPGDRATTLAVHGVSHIDTLEALRECLPTEGWVPSRASVTVSNVPDLVGKLGGAELYGNDLFVPIREMVQNARDAITARRAVEGRADDWGQITVALSREGDDWFVTVTDNGIGMSEEVICDYLLNFGTSYWQSQLLRREFPGLYSKARNQVGQYGIGFFSVFMLGKEVEVLTRRADAAAADALRVSFMDGLSWRPLISKGPQAGLPHEGGTRVRVKLGRDPEAEGGLLEHCGRDFLGWCARLCPALDVDCRVSDDTGQSYVMKANDWITISGKELLYRTVSPSADKLKWLDKLADNSRLLVDGGKPVGRGFLVPVREGYLYYRAGKMVVGGFAADDIRSFAGIVFGRSERAARNVAKPLASKKAIRDWSSGQAALLLESDLSLRDKLSASSQIASMGGDPGLLPYAVGAGCVLSRAEFKLRLTSLSSLFLQGTEFVDSEWEPVIGEQKRCAFFVEWQSYSDLSSLSFTSHVADVVCDAWGIPATDCDWEQLWDEDFRFETVDGAGFRRPCYVFDRATIRQKLGLPDPDS